jgi:hypothetical protein
LGGSGDAIKGGFEPISDLGVGAVFIDLGGTCVFAALGGKLGSADGAGDRVFLPDVRIYLSFSRMTGGATPSSTGIAVSSLRHGRRKVRREQTSLVSFEGALEALVSTDHGR